MLAEISGLTPEQGGIHVLLDKVGIRSTQRLAIARYRGGVVAAMWPGELKEQAQYLYGERHASGMIDAAVTRGWIAMGSPHLAFRNSAPGQRLYMAPACDATVYVRRWEDGDLDRVGQYTRHEVENQLWLWLRSKEYVDIDDLPNLDVFLTTQLGNRPAYLRPGLRLKRFWSQDELAFAGGSQRLAPIIRADANAILSAAAEPPLPAAAH